MLELGRFAYRPAKDLHLFAALVDGIDARDCHCSSHFNDHWGRRRPEMDAFEWTAFARVHRRCARRMAELLTQTLSLPHLLQRLQQRSSLRPLTAGAHDTVQGAAAVPSEWDQPRRYAGFEAPRPSLRQRSPARAAGPTTLNITTGRPVTMAPKGMVTCPHALASQAGVDVLRAGGTAVDAAVATAAALAVIYPHMTGLGGDAFWLIHDAKTGAVRYLDGGGRAAACASIDWFSQRGMTEVPFRGVLPATLTTPGAVASWGLAHATYGKLPLKHCLQSAIGYARDGFPVTERLAGWIDVTRADLAAHAESAAIFLPGGQVPVAGSLLRNADLARTLEAVAEAGAGRLLRRRR